jgi:hypothetical protein
MPSPKDSFERLLLRDADVKFGYENYEVLRRIGELMRSLRSEAADTAPVDANAAEDAEGPTLVELVRLAHASGKRLVVRLEEDGGGKASSEAHEFIFAINERRED